MKLVKFIKVKILKLKYPINKIKSLHERIKGYDVDSVNEQDKVNPYQLFRDWLLDIAQYGTLLTIAISWFRGYQGLSESLIMIISLGVTWWLILDFIKQVKETIKN